MPRRFLVWGLTGSVAIAMLGACAAISGLRDFTSGDCADCPEGGGGDVAPSSDVAQQDDSSSDAVEWTNPGDDGAQDVAPTGDGEGSDVDAGADSQVPYEATIEGDGEGDGEGGGGVRDAVADAPADRQADAPPDATADARADAPADAAPEATPDAAPDAPGCNNASCDGCCTSAGLCAAGGLTSACGMGGAACQNCASTGLVCSARACVSPPVDAGSDAPTDANGDALAACDPTMCANLCVPYFIQCCKADLSCGCALFFPRGTCN